MKTLDIGAYNRKDSHRFVEEKLEKLYKPGNQLAIIYIAVGGYRN